MNKKLTILSTLFVMLLWGLLFPLVKLGYTAYNISTIGDILFFAGIRFTICGVVISIYSITNSKASFKAAKSALFPILLSGLFSIILHYAFTYIGLSLTDSSKTAILKQVGMLFYVCFSFIFFKDDKLTLKKFIAAILGFSGIIAININTNGITFNIGDILIIGASFCTVFSNVISKKIFTTVNPITSTGISQLFGGIILLILGKIMGGKINLTFSPSAFIMVFICLASILSYSVWFLIVKKSELSKLFIIKFAEPVFACIFGALLLNENILKPQYIIAFFLITGGIYISQS